jgi:hypothetical protein
MECIVPACVCDELARYIDSGHGAGKTNQQRIVDQDYELRFLMNALGMNSPAPSAAKG